jgi:PiT family inorganic phosphate transporter
MVTPAIEGSAATLAILAGCLVLVLVFEFSNGFHDAANAVATVIYTNSLRPTQAVILSGFCNFLGVLVGGIAVAFALVELIPPEVLSPPNGSLAVGMLASVFISALAWNVGTWWLGIPNSSSHALIGSLIGITITAALGRDHGLTPAININQIWTVLLSLLLSPILGFLLALLLLRLAAASFRDKGPFQPSENGQPPPLPIRGLLIATCTCVSFSHGTNDGQKTIGLIMLTVIGLMPSSYALNSGLSAETLKMLGAKMPECADLIARGGDGRKQDGVTSARDLTDRLQHIGNVSEIPAAERVAIRNRLNRVIAALRTAEQDRTLSDADKGRAKALHADVIQAVEYAPWWVRVASALCLGLGTMIGYRRIVKTLGERLGRQHLAPAQGACAELVGAGLIGVAGFTGYPVSTTHVVTGGIAGTMVASGAGLHRETLRQIAWAWILTLPATAAISGGLFCLVA